MLAFGHKAAAELRTRLQAHKVPGCKDVRAATFHSFGYGVVCNHWRLLGFTRRPSVWARDADRKAVLKEALRWAAVVEQAL